MMNTEVCGRNDCG